MIALATVVLQMIVGVGKYLFAKQEEKEKALKDMVAVFKRLDNAIPRASAMRNKYKEARDRMRNKPKGDV